MNDEIENALRRAAAAWRLAMERALAPLDLTPAQFAVLRMVVEAPGSSGADLARIERLTPPTMSVIIGNLERKGALTRRAHPDNARVQCLVATARGLELQARARENTLSSRARLASAAPSDACKVILAWLRSVSEIEV